jgi:methionyl aminopeptidase
MAIRLKSKAELEKMRAAGRVVQDVHRACREVCKPGVSTQEIDETAERVIRDAGAVGLFKNYPTYKKGEGFPANLCISVNDVVVHGIASREQLIEDGDIVGIDCGVMLDGWCGDAATTIEVGDVGEEVAGLCEVTRQVLQLAIDNVRPGRRWSQIARVMQKYAEGQGYGVVRDFVGHGIGKKMHEDPKLPNYVNRELIKDDIVLREGITLAIEPMCNLGTKETLTEDDGWTVRTADGKASAHYEHTVAVTADGADVLTDGR